MNVNLFVLQYLSAQIFTNNCFCKVLFQAQTEAGSPALQADSLPTKLSGKPFFQTQCNLITCEWKIDKVKVCGESHFFSPSVHRWRYLEHDKPHFLFEGVTQEPSTMYMCCQAHRDTELSAWGRLSTFVQGNPCLMQLSSLLWVLLAFTFSGRDASKHGCECSGWKDCTQARGASQGLGEDRRIGEKQASYGFSLVFLFGDLNESNSYTI